MGLTLGMALKFYISVAKGLKLKLGKFYGLIPTFVEVTGGKLVRAPFWPSPPPSSLNRVNVSKRNCHSWVQGLIKKSEFSLASYKLLFVEFSK